MTHIHDLATLNRTGRPNDAFFAPEGFPTLARPEAETPVFTLPVSELAETATALWSGFPRVRLTGKSADGLSAHFIATTALMRFRDDVRVQFVSVGEDKSGFLIYSSSRVGYSDLGTNKKRLQDWIERLKLHLSGA